MRGTAAADEASQFTRLASSRVRLEPRRLSPLSLPPPKQNRAFLEIAHILAKETCDAAVREIKEVTGEKATVTVDGATQTWRVAASLPSLPHAEIEELRARLESAGYGTVTVKTTAFAQNVGDAAAKSGQAAPAHKSAGSPSAAPVRLVSRATTPLREVVAYSEAGAATTAAPLLVARTPIIFASDDEQGSLLKFKDRFTAGAWKCSPTRAARSLWSTCLTWKTTCAAWCRMSFRGRLSGARGIEGASGGRAPTPSPAADFSPPRALICCRRRARRSIAVTQRTSMTDRAVAETRGIIATVAGRPINALYTSTWRSHRARRKHFRRIARPSFTSARAGMRGRVWRRLSLEIIERANGARGSWFA
ncbi:MAG: hypothetical protein WKF30_03010 [Pyrinomonadaceae bacterium]